MANYKILSDSEIRAALAELPDWSLKAPNIEARFELKTFRDAIAFIVEIAIQAEVMNHHPEFHNSYNILSFSFCTHDAGMKITDLDIETAKHISALARRFHLDGLKIPRPPSRPAPTVGRLEGTPVSRRAIGGGGNAPLEFDGKVAIVTGGGGGIGYAIARAFGREGARVAIAGRTEATLAHAARTIEDAYGRSVLTVAADVAEAADCERMIAATVESLGGVDILVNNAALFAVLPLIDADVGEAARFFAVNAIGPLNGARAFARWAIAHQRGGAVVNVSSIAAGRPAPGLGLYSASKAALESLTRTMAVEWAGKGLRVNAVAPGHVATEGVLADLRTGRLDEKAVLTRIPAGRIADGDDIAEAVLFLCSNRARHILGHVLTVDGGEGF